MHQSCGRLSEYWLDGGLLMNCHKLQLCRYPSMLSPPALDVSRSMLAADILFTPPLRIDIWCTNTVYLGDLTLFLFTIESPYTNLSAKRR